MEIAEIQKLEESIHNDIRNLRAKLKFNPKGQVFIHLQMKSLEGINDKLYRIRTVLSHEKYRFVFIGAIGSGKTTAICHLFNLTEEYEKTIKEDGEEYKTIRTRELLSTGSGRTTICEVEIHTSERRAYFEIEPKSKENLNILIDLFCDQIEIRSNKDESKNKMDANETKGVNIISEEDERALRNIINLQYKEKKGNKESKIIRIDEAIELFEKIKNLEEFKNEVKKRAKLEDRIYEQERTKIRYSNTEKESEKTWLRNMFSKINVAVLPNMSIPEKIHIYLSPQIFSSENAPKVSSIIDTKGLDEDKYRTDIDKFISETDTICLFTTPFANAPEAQISTQLKKNLSFKSQKYEDKFGILVLPRNDEPIKLQAANGGKVNSWEEGIFNRTNTIKNKLQESNLDFFDDNIVFYDALRFFNDEEYKISRKYDNNSKVKAVILKEKMEVLEKLNNIIANREIRYIKEIENVRQQIDKIKSSDNLPEKIVSDISIIVDDIKKVKNLNLPGFLYDNLVDEVLNYYRRTYHWMTKHAIHARLGVYGTNSFHDMVKGVAEDENLLRKFTIEHKNNLKETIEKLGIHNELKEHTPVLISQFDDYYKCFITAVGDGIRDFLINQKMLPSNLDEIWESLKNERGSEREEGETYTGNILRRLRQRLESSEHGENLNRYFQKCTETEWTKMINKTLQFFGE